MATLLPEGKQSFTDDAGNPLVGGKLHTYDAGTNNPRPTYSDAGATVPNTNPVILDARGEATIFWDGAYKVVLKDSVDSTIWAVDNVSNINITVIGAQPKFSLAAVGASGYPVGYVLQSNDGLNSYVNIAANNTTDFNAVPSSIGVSWIPYSGQRATQSGSSTIATAAGTVDVITAAYTPQVMSLTNGMLLRFKSTGPNVSTAPTFSPNGLAAKPVVKGVGAVLFPGDINGVATVQYDSVADNWILMNPTTGVAAYAPQLQAVGATVAANTLTVTLAPTKLDFRSPTLSSGTGNTRSVPAALSVTVPTGATLGTANNQKARLVIIAMDVAGVVELAIANSAGTFDPSETALLTTTAIAAGSNSKNVVYSTTARVGVPFRVVGFLDITEAVAGVWATAPVVVQGCFGQSFAGSGSFGYGQSYQDVTASRSLGTPNFNDTGRMIEAIIQIGGGGPAGAPSSITGNIDGIDMYFATNQDQNGAAFNSPPFGITMRVKAWSVYTVSAYLPAGQALNKWVELR